jgi:hypothetical protein
VDERDPRPNQSAPLLQRGCRGEPTLTLADGETAVAQEEALGLEALHPSIDRWQAP